MKEEGSAVEESLADGVSRFAASSSLNMHINVHSSVKDRHN